MAVFIKMRTRLAGFIVVVIILCLGIFALQSAFNSNTSLFKSNSTTVGSIDGNVIDIREFQDKIQMAEENYKKQYPNQPFSEATTYGLRDQVWDQMVNDFINNNIYQKVGLDLGYDLANERPLMSKAELTDLFYGTEPHPEVKRQFISKETGQFDPTMVANYVKNMDNDKTGDARKQWNQYEKYIISDRLSTKLKNLVKKGIYIPKFMAAMDYQEKNDKVSIRYMKLQYIDIPDSTIKVTDAEMQDYLNDHKEKYKQEASRKLEFVQFEVKPSADDSAAAKKYIDDRFAKMKDNPTDTDLIRQYADKGYDQVYYHKSVVTTPMNKDTLWKAKNGSILGPWMENGTHMFFVVLDHKEVPDSVKARYILIKTKEDDTTKAKRKADSLVAIIQKGDVSFDTIAAHNSEDEANAKKGGDIGFVKQGTTFKSFNNFLFFEGKEGDIKIVKGPAGYLIVQVVSQLGRDMGIEYAPVTKKIEPSNATDKSYYDRANQFAIKTQKAEDWKKLPTDPTKEIYKQDANDLKINAYYVGSLGAARDIVKWSFEAAKDAVSGVFPVDNKYVVAHVVNIVNEGYPTVEEVRDLIKPEVIKWKKGQILSAGLQTAWRFGASLDAMAMMMNAKIKTADNLMFGNGYIPGLGQENKMLGTAFSLKEGQVSGPIAGDAGVYVIEVTHIEKSKPVADYAQYQSQIASQYQNEAEGGIAAALKKATKIKDERYKFF